MCTYIHTQAQVRTRTHIHVHAHVHTRMHCKRTVQKKKKKSRFRSHNKLPCYHSTVVFFPVTLSKIFFLTQSHELSNYPYKTNKHRKEIKLLPEAYSVLLLDCTSNEYLHRPTLCFWGSLHCSRNRKPAANSSQYQKRARISASPTNYSWGCHLISQSDCGIIRAAGRREELRHPPDKPSATSPSTGSPILGL